MGNKKSKAKWRLIWTAYLILVIPVAVPTLMLLYALTPFSYLVERIGAFKRYLIRTYKPEE